MCVLVCVSLYLCPCYIFVKKMDVAVLRSQTKDKKILIWPTHIGCDFIHKRQRRKLFLCTLFTDKNQMALGIWHLSHATHSFIHWAQAHTHTQIPTKMNVYNDNGYKANSTSPFDCIATAKQLTLDTCGTLHKSLGGKRCGLWGVSLIIFAMHKYKMCVCEFFLHCRRYAERV